MRDMRPRVVEVVLEQDSHRLTIAQTETYVADLEPEHYRWAGPLEPPPMNPTQLTWTTDKPTNAGWYWYRPASDQDIEVVQIARPHGENLHIYMLGDPDRCPSYQQVEGEWAGPLEPPR